ncbi:MAG TPA: prepilin-type N-terminal cleavage/methylation domain-containing protein [Bacilli bacterium]|nr:prepilin-type N-terminal cleavage/methylation domain-containing protein [Bacilli bacterium]
MNNKGFTLVEVLAIIVIIGIIGIITIPKISSTLLNSRDKMYDEQVNTIKSSAKKYVVLNGAKEDHFIITVQQIVDSKILKDSDVIDPRDESSFITKGSCVFVDYDTTHKNYVYNFSIDCRQE